MANRRKTSSLNDAAKMTAKQRQQAASRAAGLVVSSVVGDYSGYVLRPAAASRSRLQNPARRKTFDGLIEAYKVSYPKTNAGQGQYGGPSLGFSRAGSSVEGRRNVQVGDSFTGFGERTTNTAISSKKKQADFLASEKKKSSKAVAKNVKRRER